MDVTLVLSEEHLAVMRGVNINIDETRMAQVMRNLLSNALKFTPSSGSVTIEAKVTDEGEGSRFLTISVIDTGAGISAVGLHSLRR